MVSVSFGLCRHTARYNYGFSKSKAKHYVRAAFLSLISTGPFAVISQACGLQSIYFQNIPAGQASSPACVLSGEIWEHTQKQQESLGTSLLHLCEGSHQCHRRADGLCGSSFLSTTLGTCTSLLEGGSSYSGLHTKWTGSKSILCPAAWARRWPLWGKHCPKMLSILNG